MTTQDAITTLENMRIDLREKYKHVVLFHEDYDFLIDRIAALDLAIARLRIDLAAGV